MSKKNIFLVLLLMVFLIVMAMSIWGQQSDASSVIPATDITFFDKDMKEIQLNEDQVYEVNFECEEKDQIKFTLNILIAPEDTTDTSLTYSSLESQNFTIAEQEYPTTWITDKAGNKKHSNNYTYNIEFTKNSLSDITFYYNNKGGIAKYKKIRFTFTIVHHEHIDA